MADEGESNAKEVRMAEAHVMEEMFNILKNKPVFPGDTISHQTAAICEARGWARRDENGDLIPTSSGVEALKRWIDEETTEDDAEAWDDDPS